MNELKGDWERRREGRGREGRREGAGKIHSTSPMAISREQGPEAVGISGKEGRKQKFRVWHTTLYASAVGGMWKHRSHLK